ncbi:hypothetical protein N177_1071 [Lutibaculum baratangense AMV1]|uniref:Uncharacterized protein n=1 Tax=Lutibaculum baratangense AMV1 TaxID=631454 RepID=V4R2N0_9HYPH|nr:hypothetical protein N177_1071 [Lutibaculum baratangense AMV1]
MAGVTADGCRYSRSGGETSGKNRESPSSRWRVRRSFVHQ